jgi:arginyl-tRNA synthetase
MTRSHLRATLERLARQQSTHEVAFEVRRHAPTEFATRGEYSSNLAFALAAKIESDPQTIASRIVESWPHSDALEITATHGFLNFRMNNDTLHLAPQRARLEGRAYGTNTTLAGTRANVEFVSADPTGPLNLQHGRIAVAGDALCRLLESCGATVTREYFLNDIESSSKLRLLGESVAALYLEAFGQNSSAPEGALVNAFTHRIATALVEQRGNALLLLPEAERSALSTHAAREAAVAAHKNVLANLGVHFDVWTSESALGRDYLIESVIEKLRANGSLREQDGVTWLTTTAFGDEADRLLQRANGQYTYLAADIAYHAYRFERGYGRLLNIWTAEHRQYVERTHAALRAAGFPAEALDVLLCEKATLLRDGEPVQTQGDEPTLDEVLDQIEAETLRFLLLLPEWDTPATVETEVAARDDESNPAYAARLLPARLGTLLRQAENAKIEDQKSKTASETQLARLVALWPEEVESAAREQRPQRIARFVLEMSEATRELLATTRPSAMLCIEVLHAAQVVAQNALRILGIEPRAQF